MNMIYKVVWHAGLGIWIAVSELAKGRTKSQNNMQHPRQRSQDQIKTQKPLFIHFKRQSIVQCFLLIAVYPMVTQLSARSLTLGDYAQATGVNSLVISMADSSANAVVASASNTIAIGYNTKATDNDAIAFGRDTISSGWDSIAFGYGSQAKAYYSLAFGSQAVATSVNSVAIGKFAIASNANALAFGTSAAASGLSGIAFGELARATNTNAMAFGVSAIASQNASIAIGRQSNASKANAVALGALSTTASNATNIASFTQNGLTFTNFAGKVSDVGRQVSVGYAGFERQIKHVGSGDISAASTDAVNGSQLFATNAVLANHANSQKTLLGGNAALSSDGRVSMSNIGGTGKNTIHDAILAARNTAISGNNIIVTPTLAADGSTTYQIATTTDLKGLTRVETVDGSKTSIMTAASTTVTDGNEISMLSAKGTNVTDGSNSSLYGANGLSINGSDVVLNSTGLNVGGVTLSSTGINANAQNISNLADGEIAANSKDAVNGGQLFTVLQSTGTGTQTRVNTLATDMTKSLGAHAAYDTVTGRWTAPGYTVTTNPATAKTTQVNNVGDALTALDSAVNSPLTFSGDSGSSVNPLGSALAIHGDANLTTVVSQGKAELKLNTDLKGLTRVETVDGSKTSTMTAASTTIQDGSEISILSAKGTNVTDGSNSSLYGANGLSINGSDVMLNADGLNIGGVTLSSTGINANAQKMTNLADGLLDSDATSLGQVKSLMGNTSSSLTELGFSLQADDHKTVNQKLGKAIAITGDGQNIITQINNNKLSIQLADQLNISSLNVGASLLNAAGLTVGNTSVNANGVFIVGGPSISSSGLNAGNKIISAVANGQAASDAVNKGQLDTAINGLKGDVGHLATGAVQYDKNTDGSINKNAISLAGGSNGTLISNVADGQIATGSKDAVNGGQLAAVQDNLQTQITQNTQNISQIQNQFNTGAIGLVKQTDARADITVAQQIGGTRVNVAGTDGHRVVTGVKDGNVATGSSDAVTGNQLYANYEHMAAGLGGGAAYDNNTWTAPSYTVGHGDRKSTVNNVGDAVSALNRADEELNQKMNTFVYRYDEAFKSTNKRMNRLEKDNKAAVASAIAIASLPQPVEKGRVMLAAGTGVWQGQMGISVGASGVTDDKILFSRSVNYIWKMATTADSQGNWGGGASVGVQW